MIWVALAIGFSRAAQIGSSLGAIQRRAPYTHVDAWSGAKCFPGFNVIFLHRSLSAKSTLDLAENTPRPKKTNKQW